MKDKKVIGRHIQDYITINIQSNKWKVGTKILSERQLAVKFGTTAVTVKKVLFKFIDNGILEPKYRKGYFVCNENILSPGDYLGLIPNPSFRISFEEMSINNFSAKDNEIFKEITGQKTIEKLKIFKKITKLGQKIVKTTFIGINLKKYEHNADIVVINRQWFNGGFNVKIFNAVIGDLISEKIDVITTSSLNINNPKYKNFVCFHSISKNKDDEVIEYAVTYVAKEHFMLKTKNKII